MKPAIYSRTLSALDIFVSLNSPHKHLYTRICYQIIYDVYRKLPFNKVIVIYILYYGTCFVCLVWSGLCKLRLFSIDIVCHKETLIYIITASFNKVLLCVLYLKAFQSGNFQSSKKGV